MTQNVEYSNHLIFQLKKQHNERIMILEKKISDLQFELKILQDFYERIDDL